jgi:CRP/FNR family transcriptional regulator, cyclic AMP receptor protein
MSIRRDAIHSASVEERLDVLLSTVPFSVLGEPSLLPMAEHLTQVRFRRGEVIYREGEPAGELFIVHRGQVKLTLHGPGHRRQLLAIAGANQVFGEPGIIDHGPRAMDAEAMDDCELFGMDADVFWSAIESHPEFARRVIELLGERLRRADRKTNDLIFYDAPTRLARKLIDLAEDYGEGHGSGIEVSVRMTQGELAQMLGMSRPNVNRLIADFESRGWLDWNEGRPILLRPEEILRLGG